MDSDHIRAGVGEARTASAGRLGAVISIAASFVGGPDAAPSDTHATGRRRLRAAGALLGDAVAAGSERVEELHRGIAGRAFAGVGPSAAPVRAVHDAVATAAYSVVRVGVRAAGHVGGAIAAVTPLAEQPRLTGREAALVEGAVFGMYGDRIVQRHPELSLPMTLRSGGDDVALTREALAAAYPAAGTRVALFLHGLCETENSWGRPAESADTPGTYGDQLRRHLGLTPLFLRYNSGLHISENGARLSALLDQLVAAWPQRIDDIALVGHSMGGLVMRSACDIAVRDERPWVARLRHCVYLGTPHDGAPLERAVNMLAGTLRVLPETRPLATLLDVRSAGIKDLRFGYLRDDDWQGRDPDAVLVDTGSDLPLLATAQHHCVAATLGDTPRHVLSRLLGDLLVLHSSASGHGRRGVPLKLGDADRRHVARATHFHLLDHPAVADLLRDWLSDPSG